MVDQTGQGKPAEATPVIILRMSHQAHRAASPTHIRCYVLTVSDTRTEENDTGGRLLCELLEGDGHEVLGHAIVPDEPSTLRGAIEQQLDALPWQQFSSIKMTLDVLFASSSPRSRQMLVQGFYRLKVFLAIVRKDL